MPIERREVVAMRDDHDDGRVAIRDVRTTDGDDLAGRGGAQRRVLWRRDVEAVVEATPAGAETGCDRSVDRPHRQLRAVERAEAALGRELRGKVRVLTFGVLELAVEIRRL